MKTDYELYDRMVQLSLTIAGTLAELGLDQHEEIVVFIGRENWKRLASMKVRDIHPTGRHSSNPRRITLAGVHYEP